MNQRLLHALLYANYVLITPIRQLIDVDDGRPEVSTQAN